MCYSLSYCLIVKKYLSIKILLFYFCKENVGKCMKCKQVVYYLREVNKGIRSLEFLEKSRQLNSLDKYQFSCKILWRVEIRIFCRLNAYLCILKLDKPGTHLN